MTNWAKYFATILWCVILLVGCGRGKALAPYDSRQDQTYKEFLQGLWVDGETGSVEFRVDGDTIFFAEATLAPQHFHIHGDSLFVDGSHDSTPYYIISLTEQQFSYLSLAGDLVKLHKSETQLDVLQFETLQQEQCVQPTTTVIARDSVVMYHGHRYRGYTYINPSQMKVYRSTYSEMGMSVEQVYYDNVVHIRIYELKECLYTHDFYKFDFAHLIPEEYLREAILADMHFMGVDEGGYLYQALVGIPEEVNSYVIAITISFDGEISMKIKE